jgi:hypothetical protein
MIIIYKTMTQEEKKEKVRELIAQGYMAIALLNKR